MKHSNNKHFKRFLYIAVIIFTAVFVAHLYVLLNDVEIQVAGMVLPKLTSILAVFISGSMIAMSSQFCKGIGKK